MKSFNLFLAEASGSDSMTAADFDSEKQITAYLLKDPQIRKHVGKTGIYFDGNDLVFGDKDVARGVLGSDGWDHTRKMSEYKRLILKIQPPADPTKAAPAGSKKIGKFTVSMPTELSGTLGSSATKLSNPRMIITVSDDSDAATIKKMHSAPKGVIVKVMKRKTGSQIYVDFKKDDAEVAKFAAEIAKIK